MATVLIVSRTQMANGICVGGINEDTGELIRLHNEKGGNFKSDAPYMVGERLFSGRPGRNKEIDGSRG